MKNLFTLFSILIMFSVNIFAQEPIDTDGDGYRNISTLEELRWISENDSSWSWNFELDNDIDASDTRNWNVGDHDGNPNTPDIAMGWKPLGTWKKEFSGSINGNGHSIENLYIFRPYENNIAFISYAKSSTIELLNLKNCDFSGYDYVSSMIVNTDLKCKIYYSSTTGKIKGQNYISGFILYNNAIINDSYSQVDIQGASSIGTFLFSNTKDIYNCYYAGKIDFLYDEYPVGFAQENTRYIYNCFWDLELSGLQSSIDNFGKTSAEMKNRNTYVNAGWDFSEIWDITTDYPYIKYSKVELQDEPKDTDEDGYINIKTLDDLKWFSENSKYLDKNFELDNDIDASDTKNWPYGWRPIGNFENPFRGKIKGNGFSINNLFIDRPESDYVGFIGNSESQLIENISFNNIDVTGRNFTGGLVGYITLLYSYYESSTLSNCVVEGSISGNDNVGFIAGYSKVDSLSNCNATGVIEGNMYVGGLIGKSSGKIFESYYNGNINANSNVGGISGSASGDIYNCYSLGEIIASGNNVGGLCGNSNSSITNSYSEIKIAGVENVGGIAGINSSLINKCNYIGEIDANENAGGIVGFNKAVVKNSYSDGTIIGTNDCIGGLCGQIEKENNSCGIYIENSYSKMDVSGKGKVGGLVGSNKAGHIIMSYSIGRVTGVDYVGGLVGNNTASISRCYSHSEVSGNKNVGGLVGDNYEFIQDISRVYDCFSTGKVTGNENIGGLIGSNNNDHVSGFWDIETSGINISDGGIGKTTVEMKDINTYQYWNFNLIWDIDNDYPFINFRLVNKPQDTDGDGYINIKTLDDLRWLSESGLGLDENWELDNDIDASETQHWNGGAGFNPISMHLYNEVVSENYCENYFSGKFEGNNNSISNLTINMINMNNVGFFSYLRGQVKNLHLKNCNIVGKSKVGAIAGYSAYYTFGDYAESQLFPFLNEIINCTVTGNIDGMDNIGGISGRVYYTRILLCITDVNITGNDNIGGIIGSYYTEEQDIYSNRIKFCGSKGKITGNDYVGGLIGYCEKPVTSSYSQADVKGNSYVGGLLGQGGSIYHGELSICVSGCYSSGLVQGNYFDGGLIGFKHDSVEVYGSYWDVQTSGISYSDGGVPKTTEELYEKELFLSEGWNFDFIWDIEDGYPFIDLKEEMRPEDTDGNGYLNIKNLTDLRWLSETDLDLDKYWELDSDLNAADTKNWNLGFGFEPIGDTTNIFIGNFNGNGHIIDSLYINCPYEKYVAFIGVAKDTILNLGLENINIIANKYNDYVAGFVSKMISGKVENCYTTGLISDEYDNAYDKITSGFIVELGEYFMNYDFTFIFDTAYVSNCYSNCQITSEKPGPFSGFVGHNIQGIINKCYSLGKVNTPNGRVAGFVNRNFSIINNSFSRTELKGKEVGGFAYASHYVDIININNCYYAGNIIQKDSAAGFVYYRSHHDGSTDYNTSFWDYEVSGIDTSLGGIAKNTLDMKTKSTFTDVGWDFENIWYITPEINDGYPFFIGMDSIPSAVAERLISDSDILIYPNPAEDYIEISIKKPSEGLEPSEGSSIVIYDVLGDVVWKSTLNTLTPALSLRERELRIDISHLPKGVYFVRVGGNGQKFVKK